MKKPLRKPPLMQILEFNQFYKIFVSGTHFKVEEAVSLLLTDMICNALGLIKW